MLVKANNDFADRNSRLYGLSLDLSADFESYLTALFEQAIKRDELSHKLSAIEYARFFQVQFAELRCYFNRPGVEPLAHPMINQMFALMKNYKFTPLIFLFHVKSHVLTLFSST